MEKVSKSIFKEIMEYVKEFEALGNKWCLEDDISSVAKSRSYAKKIMNAMKPYIESSIKETDSMIATATVEAAKVVQEVIEVPVEPVIEEVKVEEVKVAEVKVEEVKETKETKPPTRGGFNFNKNKK